MSWISRPQQVAFDLAEPLAAQRLNLPDDVLQVELVGRRGAVARQAAQEVGLGLRPGAGVFDVLALLAHVGGFVGGPWKPGAGCATYRLAACGYGDKRRVE